MFIMDTKAAFLFLQLKFKILATIAKPSVFVLFPQSPTPSKPLKSCFLFQKKVCRPFCVAWGITLLYTSRHSTRLPRRCPYRRHTAPHRRVSPIATTQTYKHPAAPYAKPIVTLSSRNVNLDNLSVPKRKTF